MKRALIELPSRVAEIIDPTERDQFPVAPPLFWANCPDDATPETHYFDGSAVAPIPAQVVPPQPDVAGLRAQLPIAVGGPLQANALAAAYPLFDTFLVAGNFPAAQVLLDDALAKAVLTADQHAAIVATAAAHNVPLQ